MLAKLVPVPKVCVVGVDLGGTNVRAGAYLDDGAEASAKFTNPSNALVGVEAVADAVASVIHQAMESSGIPVEAIGLAIPGHIDDAVGLVRWAPNFEQDREVWRDVPLKRLVQERVGVPVHTGNDANLAALGEYQFGTGKGSARCLLIITLGTGVGGGIVLSPAAVHGKASGPLVLLGGNKGGAEFGHVSINRDGPDLGPVPYGALECYCGAKAIVNRAQHKLRYGRPSAVADAVQGDLSKITPLTLSTAAAKGDGVAIEVWTEVGEYLGVALGGFINIFAPDVVAIGGQISKAGDVLMTAVRRTARDVAIPTLYADVNIVQAERVEDAGILGAAALALEAIR
ncbi:MAG: glucokinase [Fimbriimonadaceae bacterium]|jgi:glucokinase|nr:glucokinase [Fimbriimonadaceae bacterium]